jgi:hypothetical protein
MPCRMESQRYAVCYLKPSRRPEKNSAHKKLRRKAPW